MLPKKAINVVWSVVFIVKGFFFGVLFVYGPPILRWCLFYFILLAFAFVFIDYVLRGRRERRLVNMLKAQNRFRK